MYQSLVPCPSCARHVRVAADATCPFCSAPLPASLASRAVPAATERLSRAALFVFATTVGVGAAGCASAIDPQADGSTAQDSGGVFPMYGAPFRTDAGVASDAATGPDDHGGGMADYGAPPPRDGG